MPAYLHSPTHSHSTQTSDQATNDQLEVEVVGTFGEGGVGSRFVADDSLSFLEVHRVGLVIISNPIIFSLKNNCTVLAIELETN